MSSNFVRGLLAQCEAMLPFCLCEAPLNALRISKGLRPLERAGKEKGFGEEKTPLRSRGFSFPQRRCIIVSMEKNETVSEKLLDESIDELCSLLAKTTDVAFIKDFLVCLCTSAEIKDFANRWLLVKEIDRGATQREIAKEFGMSLCKITRGSRELRKPDSAFRKMLNMLKENK